MDVFLEKIIEKQSIRDFNEMLRLFRELDNHGYSLPPRFAVLKACTIQVADNSYGYSLHDVELCLLEVINNDENYIDAYLELGFYYYSIEDDCEKALKCFSNAIDKSTNHLREAIIGKTKSLADLHRHTEALACLDEKLIDEKYFELIRKELCG